LAIERFRFGERLHVALDCPEELENALVPSFILQPLVENVVKHAVGHSAQPVSARISALQDGGDLLLLVENDGPSTAPPSQRTRGGIGLANTRTRLQMRYLGAASLETERTPEGFRATIRMPVVLPPDGTE